MVTHSNILAWRIPMDRSPVGYSPWGRKESDTNEQLSTARCPCLWSSLDYYHPAHCGPCRPSWGRGLS